MIKVPHKLFQASNRYINIVLQLHEMHINIHRFVQKQQITNRRPVARGENRKFSTSILC